MLEELDFAGSKSDELAAQGYQLSLKPNLQMKQHGGQKGSADFNL